MGCANHHGYGVFLFPLISGKQFTIHDPDYYRFQQTIQTIMVNRRVHHYQQISCRIGTLQQILLYFFKVNIGNLLIGAFG